MARRKEPPAPVVASRPFTQAALDRIRQLTAQPPYEQKHEQRRAIETELESIHAAAGRPVLGTSGRRRGFMSWELSIGMHDPEAAFQEECAGDFARWQPGPG